VTSAVPFKPVPRPRAFDKNGVTFTMCHQELLQISPLYVKVYIPFFFFLWTEIIPLFGIEIQKVFLVYKNPGVRSKW